MELESFEIGVPPKKLSYDFWPREGESIALAWGRLKSMLYSCPNHELSREIIIQNFMLGFLVVIKPCLILRVLFYEEDY